jgi:uncharacterized protein
MNRILVSGASGLIGKVLVNGFEFQGAQIVRLVRGRAQNETQLAWDPGAPLSPAAVSGFDTVIHLAGESVVRRWNPEKKRAIRESRILGTRNLATALVQATARPRLFICASAVGFYGNRGDELLTEESAAGTGFAADLARDWEAESRIAAEAGIRTVNLRLGLVLAPKGGALEKVLTPFKLGLGGRLGAGTQWWSWIHIGDIVRAIQHMIRTEALFGPVNLVAPAPVRNEEFTRALAAALKRPALFPVPAFAARLAFGEMAEELMLSSQRVVPEKLETSGYKFLFPELTGALQNLLG